MIGVAGGIADRRAWKLEKENGEANERGAGEEADTRKTRWNEIMKEKVGY